MVWLVKQQGKLAAIRDGHVVREGMSELEAIEFLAREGRSAEDAAKHAREVVEALTPNVSRAIAGIEDALEGRDLAELIELDVQLDAGPSGDGDLIADQMRKAVADPERRHNIQLSENAARTLLMALDGTMARLRGTERACMDVGARARKAEAERDRWKRGSDEMIESVKAAIDERNAWREKAGSDQARARKAEAERDVLKGELVARRVLPESWDRTVELAERLTAPGRAGALVSASEMHELRDGVLALVAALKGVA